MGWVYQYALVDRSGKHDLAQLRSLQDWFLKYELQAVPGVSEVATVGGMVKQYQVVLDPNVLRAYGLPLMADADAVQRSNQEVGGAARGDGGGSVFRELGRVPAQHRRSAQGRVNSRRKRSPAWRSRQPWLPRGRGSGGTREGGKTVPVAAAKGLSTGSSMLLEYIADIRLGPEMRQGIADLDGQGEVVGGIVLMRPGENALNTIEAVKAKLAELKEGLPAGVELVEVYDRSGLIKRAIDTLTQPAR